MWIVLKENVVRIACAVWCHRMVYAGLAGAYGAGCLGWLEKDAVQQIATGCYLILVAQRGH